MLSLHASGVMSAYCITEIHSQILQLQGIPYSPSPEVFSVFFTWFGDRGMSAFEFCGGLLVGCLGGVVCFLCCHMP